MIYKIYLHTVALDKIKLVIFVDCEFTTVCLNKDSKGCVGWWSLAARGGPKFGTQAAT